MPKILNTEELKQHITSVYERLKIVESNNDLFEELDVFFSKGTPMDIEGSYVYTDQNVYYYGYTERGEVKQLRKTSDLFEITYWIISDQVFKAALKYATKHADKNQDFRRTLFKKELEMLKVLGDEYFKKRERAINDILIDAPYDDNM